MIDEIGVMDRKYGSSSSTWTQENPIWLDDYPHPSGTM
jgi:hypothetical protein